MLLGSPTCAIYPLDRDSSIRLSGCGAILPSIPQEAPTFRYAQAAARLAKANFTRLDAPLKLNFCLTYWCQYRCKTCNIWQRKPSNELTTSEISAFVQRNRQTAWLDLTGGEIFLRKDIDDIFDEVVTSWPRLAIIHFPTNGFLTDHIVRTAERLARTSTARIVITVSVDGDQRLNDEIRGIQGGYARQMETFNALRRITGLTVVLGVTLSSFNAGRFLETYAALRHDCPGLTPDDVHLNVAQISNHYYGNAATTALLPSRPALQHDLDAYRSMRGMPVSLSAWLERVFLARLDDFATPPRTPMRCHSLRSSCFIDPWGTVYPCITYDRPVGSLRDHGMDLAAVWHSDAAKQIQREIWRGDCPQCWTACEAYHSILGNLLRPFDRTGSNTHGTP